jgi:hypothetical protein
MAFNPSSKAREPLFSRALRQAACAEDSAEHTGSRNLSPFGLEKLQTMKLSARTAFISAFLLFPILIQAQGFGAFGRKIVPINRLLPPTVNLKGKRIRIEASAAAVQATSEQVQALLKTKLVTLIQKDPRFILNDTNPQTILKFTVTNVYTDIYVSGKGTEHETRSAHGKIEVAYQAMDVETNQALDSENLVQEVGYDPKAGASFFDFNVDKKKRAAEGSENEARDQMVDGIVSQMARRIAPLDEPFDAPLPGKKLEPLSALAVAHRWGAVEEQAEKLDKLPRPDDDSYRQYLVALAKEAQAYDLTREANDFDLGKRADITQKQADDDFNRAQKYLDDAAEIYKEILGANPKEKEFRTGDARTEEAVAIYAKIVRYKEENAKAQIALAAAKQQASKSISLAAGSSASPDGQQGPLEQVLSFCSKGIAVDSIKEYILSPDFLADAKETGYRFSFARDSVRLNDICKANAAVLQKLIRDRLNTGTPRAAAKKQP